MLLVVDNGSIYTKNLLEFLSKLKLPFTSESFERIRPDTLDEYSSFILSGRRKNNKEMNSTNSKIIRFAISKNKPLLGICYGAEMLALTVGGTIKKMQSLQKGENKISVHKSNPLCTNDIEVFESHNYEISSTSKQLLVVASSNSCKNEIIRFQDNNIFGVQFHPEMNKDGQKLIENFCSLDGY